MKIALVPLADGCEELEAITITNILTRAGVQVTTAGLKEGVVKASRGATLVPNTTLEAVINKDFDLIVLPGGLPGANYLAENMNLRSLIQSQHAQSKPIAAICAAPRALAAADILTDRKITSYPGSLADLNPDWTDTAKAIETDGHIITGRSPGVALDFALELVKRLLGQEKMDEVEAALVR